VHLHLEIYFWETRDLSGKLAGMNSKVLEVGLVLGILVLLVVGFTPSWTQTSATTNQNWLGIASSADGKIVCAINSGSPPLLSTNGGVNWVTNGNVTAYAAIALSADGTKWIMSAFTNSGIFILVSTNLGNTWTQTILPNGDWLSAASSADGARLVAAIKGGFIYVSTNSGATWKTNTTLSKFWTSVASSADGNQLFAAASGDKIYSSTNSGLNWTATGAPTLSWNSICSSSDGRILAATVYFHQLRQHLGNDQHRRPVGRMFVRRNEAGGCGRSDLDLD
jgi:photosystem II stability/assembly factor-like uncharacterized protein